jgi:8-oxo-dGTP diphosphatase
MLKLDMFKYFVVGFAFNTQRDTVALIEKQRPEWQRGKLNGIGGAVEPTDKSFHAAMAREFQEETGVWIPPDKWRLFAKLAHNGNGIYCFTAVSDAIADVTTLTDEPIRLAPIESYGLAPVIQYPYIPVRNLRYLVSLALDEEQHAVPLFVYA